MNTDADSRRTDITVIAAFALVSFWPLLFLLGVFSDDNCWLLSVFNTTTLSGYLDTGFRELRRVPQGVFLYAIQASQASGEHMMALWQVLNLLLQAATALFIYFLVRLFPGSARPAAFFSALCFLAVPLDTTQPLISNMMTRTGLFLSVVSLWGTVKFFTAGRQRRYYALSFLAAVTASYSLVEAAIALEPARLLLAVYFYRQGGRPFSEALKKSALFIGPFLLACIPLAVYKITCKPYGVYASFYETGLRFVFSPRNWKDLLKFLLLDNWFGLARYAGTAPVSGALSACAAALLSWFALGRADLQKDTERVAAAQNVRLILFGLALLLPVAVFYMYSDKVPHTGYNSRHAILMQFGYSLILGGGCAYFSLKWRGSRYLKPALALFFALGVFFVNLNLEQYFKTWRHKQQFWRAFEERFPALPPKADFVMDVEVSGLLYSYNAGYEFELPLNLLYSRAGQRGGVRVYRVLHAREFAGLPRSEVINTTGHYGRDSYALKALIPVVYKDGVLYTGPDTRKNHGDKVMAEISGNPVPAAADSAAEYPLRRFLKGYL